MNKHRKLYTVWNAAKNRCHNPQHQGYANYGGRGIFMCEKWLYSVDAFIADMGPSFEKGLELDRIDNDKGYFKDNCRWITRAENCRNTRSSKLDQKDVDWIRENPEGLTQLARANMLNISLSMVNHIVKGNRWL